MIFSPQNTILKDGHFKLDALTHASAHACLDNDDVKELWHGACFRCARLKTDSCEDIVFRVGAATALPLCGEAYTINIEETGLCISAASESELMHGYMTLIDRIKMYDDENGTYCALDCCEIRESALIGMRAAHFCIFPETELFELERFVRICAALKFTHIIPEFWGMLKYDALDALSWRSAFSKDEVRPIFDMAHKLGLEIIPMFNSWGHASACRVMHGKHVVLDQDPTLASYFTDNGWCWDIRKPKVRALLRQIRQELCELCGEGGYFHIGCDEAYDFELTRENMDFICDYINELGQELKSCGRRAIAWGDMFIHNDPAYNKNNAYSANAPTKEKSEYMLSRLSRDIVIADWQYDATEAPVETSLVFKRAGFDTVICPWDRSKNKLDACTRTALEHELYGMIYTTWHTTTDNLPYIALAAKGAYEGVCEKNDASLRADFAAFLRRVYFANGDYSKAGWCSLDVGKLW